MLNVVLFGKTAKQWKDENPTEKGNMLDAATINQLLVLANLESYNAVLINQGKNQKMINSFDMFDISCCYYISVPYLSYRRDTYDKYM